MVTFDPELTEPVHGAVAPVAVVPDTVVDTVGAGIGSIGLRPAPAVSVASSGIVPPTRLAPVFAASVDEAPVVLLVELELQLDVELMPPPSKVELELMLPIGVVAPLELQLELGAGLRPPGSTSVAASGMVVLMLPLPLLPFEPRVPSGDVAPKPDDMTAVCALAALEQRTASAANVNRDRIQGSYRSFCTTEHPRTRFARAPGLELKIRKRWSGSTK
ncbi:hypothetical protein [Bradyrhizobium sp. LA6.7]|uniref:hypothetical protein n=1 Tax=unclassified Bradyrhizobium TaxID=2631580 RepID=UPI003397336C